MKDRYVASMAGVVKVCREAAVLRRQVEELTAELDSVLRFLVDVLRRDIGMTEEAIEDHSKIVIARAALARVGSECETCEHSQLPAGGGHCYMFKEKPVGQCAQWRQARVGGGGGEEAGE